MNGLAQNPSDLNHLYVACDNSPHGDTIGKLDFAGNFGPSTGCPEAKGAAFGNCTTDPADGGCLWAMCCDQGGVSCREWRVQRWFPDLTGKTYWALDGFGVAWDGEALWISYQVEQKARRYLPEQWDGPVAEVSLPFVPRDLAWKDGYLWASDHTNDKIQKIDPVSGDILETWIQPVGVVGNWLPLGLEWGIVDGMEVLWCANGETETVYALVADCDDGNPCTIDTCNADSECEYSYAPPDTLCRPAAGECDVDEFCPGDGPDCPGDELEPGGTVCRSSMGPCDPEETCDGTGAACPADVTITACIHGDGCCPSACNANNDDDCLSVCGNNIIEPGEECDGTDDQACPGECQGDCTCLTVVPVPTVSQWGLAIMMLLLVAGMKIKFGRYTVHA